MAWTATVKYKEKVDGKLRVIVTFSDGTTSFDENMFLTSSDSVAFSRAVQSRIDQLAALDTLNSGLTPGSTVVAPATDPTPSLAQQHQTTFRNDWLKLQGALRLVNAGLIPSTDARLTAFQSKVTNEMNQVVADSDFNTLLTLL